MGMASAIFAGSRQARLPAGLGVDALWLMPIMPSPFADSGYDIADYRGDQPRLRGRWRTSTALLAAAHARGMRVMIDLV